MILAALTTSSIESVLAATLSGVEKVALYLLILGVLILFHELGHMVVAKRAGVTVSEFAMGFGPRLFAIERGGTLYTVNLLPLGGFCRMVGEDSADDGSPDPGNFQHKPLYARFGIILAGPFFNFLLAALLFTIVGVAIGQPVPTDVIGQVRPDTPAAAAHLQPGDEIRTLDGRAFRSGTEIMDYIHARPNRLMDVAIERDGKVFHLKIKTTYGPVGDGTKQGLLGYLPTTTALRMPFFEGVVWGVSMVPLTIATQWYGIVQMIATHDTSGLHGPVGIAQVVSQVAQYGIGSLVELAAMLSVILGMFNLLPIPALDGGRLAFMVVELVRGRRVDPEKEGLVHLTGFALLMVFIAFVTYHDIANWISGKGAI
ncbi:MAG TPA: M50 family metallopeptidase [Candidatus Eremiobacteraceae bacterium]|nr:M50 family metallopeptidase [Candidatus Eremiobacteraceae bacterium]